MTDNIIQLSKSTLAICMCNYMIWLLYWLFSEKSFNFFPNSFNYRLFFFGINLLHIFDGEVVEGTKANGQHGTHKTDDIVGHTEVRSRQGH